MPDFEDLKGRVFERLTVLEYKGTNKHHKRLWECKCECGTVRTFVAGNLKSGTSKSCGCLEKELLTKRNTIHGYAVIGHKYQPLHQRWLDIKKRCYNSKFKSYKNYGGRGIKVCDEWLDDVEAFVKWSLANGYSPELQLDREDNDGDYTPDNCRYVTCRVNILNRRMLPVNGNKYVGVGLVVLADGIKVYRPAVKYKDKTHYMGTYYDEESAITARDEYIIAHGFGNKLQVLNPDGTRIK